MSGYSARVRAKLPIRTRPGPLDRDEALQYRQKKRQAEIENRPRQKKLKKNKKIRFCAGVQIFLLYNTV